ncbi:MAG TPA: hypothetical protein VML96_12610 [Egibacteraceae bacterium]|nr:hypothetical protein [Egibacteraceae bacterium]
MQPLEDLTRRLAGLAAQPVSAHPQALDEVHEIIVGELDALARLGSSGGSASAAVS